MTETIVTTQEEQEEQEQATEAPDVDAPCTAELAECTCPEFCERDHDNE